MDDKSCAGCGRLPDDHTDRELAACLGKVFDEFKEAYEKKHGRVKAPLSFFARRLGAAVCPDVPSSCRLDRFCQACGSLVQKINRQAIASAFLRKFGGVYVMKLNPGSIKEIDNTHPIELFRRGINDDETLSGYTAILRNALCTALEDVLHGTYEERAAEFVKIGKEDPITACNIILHLVAMWCEQARLEPSDSEYMSPWTIRVNLNTIKNLFDMNDVAFTWRRAYEMCPEKRYCSPNPAGRARRYAGCCKKPPAA